MALSFFSGLFLGGSDLAASSCLLWLAQPSVLFYCPPAAEMAEFTILFGVYQAIAQEQCILRSATWNALDVGIPERDGETTHGDTAPVTNFAGGAVVSWRRTLVTWYDRIQQNRTFLNLTAQVGCPSTCCIELIRLALRKFKWVFECLSACLRDCMPEYNFASRLIRDIFIV